MIKEYINKEHKFSKEEWIGIIALTLVLSGVFGWLYEVIFYFLNSGCKTWYMRGGNFLPFINIYMHGAILILLFGYKNRKHPLKVFLISALATGILEFFSGYILYGVMGKVRCWSYNEEIWNWGNIGGYVCLRSVTFFGLSALFLIYILVPLLMKLARKVKNKKRFMIISLVILGIFLVDELYNLIFPKFGFPKASSFYKKLGFKYIYFNS